MPSPSEAWPGGWSSRSIAEGSMPARDSGTPALPDSLLRRELALQEVPLERPDVFTVDPSEAAPAAIRHRTTFHSAPHGHPSSSGQVLMHELGGERRAALRRRTARYPSNERRLKLTVLVPHPENRRPPVPPGNRSVRYTASIVFFHPQSRVFLLFINNGGLRIIGRCS